MGHFSAERKRNLAYVVDSLLSKSKSLGESDWIILSKVLAGIELKFGVTLETAQGYLSTLNRAGLINIDPEKDLIEWTGDPR